MDMLVDISGYKYETSEEFIPYMQLLKYFPGLYSPVLGGDFGILFCVRTGTAYGSYRSLLLVTLEWRCCGGTEPSCGAIYAKQSTLAGGL